MPQQQMTGISQLSGSDPNLACADGCPRACYPACRPGCCNPPQKSPMVTAVQNYQPQVPQMSPMPIQLPDNVAPPAAQLVAPQPSSIDMKPNPWSMQERSAISQPISSVQTQSCAAPCSPMCAPQCTKHCCESYD